MKKIVLTGGPSVGKTTMIELLAAEGYTIIPEAARMIIEEERLKENGNVPSKNLLKFQELVLERQCGLENSVPQGLVFIDRGIVDGIAYCRYGNVPVPQKIFELAPKRYDLIFLLDQLGMYEEDGIRSRKLEDSVALHTLIEAAYRECGYEPLRVPVLPPVERVKFILQRIGHV